MKISELIAELEGILEHYGVDAQVHVLDILRGGEVHELAFSEQLYFDERSKNFYICTDDPENRPGYGG